MTARRMQLPTDPSAQTDDLPLFARPKASTADALFDSSHPGVFTKFVEFAEQVRARGKTRYSADAILHRIRWWSDVERQSGEYALNNNWTSYLARRLMRERPEFDGFFETRERKSA